MMEIVETTDHFLQTVYRVYEGTHRLAEAYTKRDAEVIKRALEEDKKNREREENSRWF